MQYKIPCTDQLSIDDNYQLWSNKNEQLYLPVVSNQVQIDIQHQTRNLSLEWLYLYARHAMPEFINIDHIRFIPLPSTFGIFPWRAMFTQPYWYSKTHRVVPMCPTLAVDRSGNVINIFTHKECKPWKEEYLVIGSFRHTHNCYKPMRVHVLVANAWIITRQDTLHPVCNHKDGNKYNPNVTNLEWVTIQENALHARDTGLLPYVKNCRLRDKDTGEIHQFASIKQAASFLGRKAAHLYKEAKLINHLFNGKYEFRISGDDRPWLYTPDVIVMNDAAARYIIRIEESDCVRVFNGAQPFAQFYNLLNSENPLSIRIYLNRFKRMYPQFRLTLIDQCVPKVIQILDVVSNKVFEFSTMAEAANTLNLRKAAVRYSLTLNGTIIHKNYRIRYKSEEPWPDTDSLFINIPVKLTNKQTGEQLCFPSLTTACEGCGLSLRKIRRMLTNPRETDNYSVEKIEKGSETSRKT